MFEIAAAESVDDDPVIPRPPALHLLAPHLCKPSADELLVTCGFSEALRFCRTKT